MADLSGLHGAEHMEAKTFHCMGNISKTNYKYTCPHFFDIYIPVKFSLCIKQPWEFSATSIPIFLQSRF